MKPEKVSTLIDELMKTDDPATVGLRRILKSKKQQGTSFPLQSQNLQDFGGASSGTKISQKIFSVDEKRVLEIEKKNIALNSEVQKLKKELDAKLKKSFDDGYLKGKVEGQKDGSEIESKKSAKEIEQIESKMVTVLQDVVVSKKNILKTAHSTVLELSLAIAKKIVATELTINKDVVISVIKKAITHVVDKDSFVVRVSPEDISNVVDKKEFWTSISQRLDDVSIEEDDRITIGGCIIESETGEIDARIETQLSEMEDIVSSAWDSVFAGDMSIEELEVDSPEPEIPDVEK